MHPFWLFYFGAYQAEHQHPGTVALHLAGTVLGVALIVVAGVLRAPWLALLFPVVHGSPGLLGHRLFERNAAVGDVRVTRKDYPLTWFIAANHLLLIDLVKAKLMGQSRAALLATRSSADDEKRRASNDTT